MIIVDQLKRQIELSKTPIRVVSCVPSITELLFLFIPAEHIIARTKFCIHPKHIISRIPKIGGTKTLHLERIKALKPDLIIANKEENNKVQIDELANNFPTYVSDIHNLDSCKDFISDLGDIFSKTTIASNLISEIQNEISNTSNTSQKSALYLIWKDPYMTVGTYTYIHDIMTTSGFSNCIAPKTRYPKITVEQINSYRPEIILLSSEPFPFSDNHIVELKQNLDYSPKIILVDGEMFSWYGAKTLPGLKYARKLRQSLHQDT